MLVALSAIAIVGLPIPPETVPVLTWRGDPATTMSVTWRDQSSSPVELICQDSRGTRHVASADAQPVKLPSGARWNYRTARFAGLSPGTEYAYKVPGGNHYRFRTAKTSGKIKFLYFGDVQTEIHRAWPPVMEKAIEKCPDAAFMVFAGDLVDSAHDDSQWVDFFRPGGRFFGQIPSVATPGNHEYKTLVGNDPATLSFHWRPQWDYPLNGFAQVPEQGYVLDIQGIRIVSLNSNRFVREQTKWFDELMSNPSPKWTFVTFHHPVFSQAVGRDNPLVRKNWDPVFRKHNVAIALQGHDHTYGRRLAKRSDGKSATAYVVAVAGKKMYRLSQEAKRTSEVSYEKTQSFQIVEVDGDTLRYDSYDLTGNRIDFMTMKKGPNGENRVVESFRKR